MPPSRAEATSGLDLPALTGLRAVACAWVFASHAAAGYMPRLPAPWQDLTFPGYLGVDIFFVLSGYILFTVYPGLAPRQGVALPFYVKRLFRVYPLNIFLMMYIATNAWVHGRIGPGWFDPHSFLPYLLMLENFWPRLVTGGWLPTNWSVGVELVCYFVLPLAVVPIRRASTAALCGALLLMAVAQAVALNHFGYRFDDVSLICRGALGFFAGTLTAGLVARCAPVAPLAPAGQICAMIIFPVLLFLHFYAVVPLCATMLIAAMTWQTGPACTILRLPPLVWLGNISYSIYLVHGLVLGDWSGVWLRDARAALPEPVASLAWFTLVVGTTLGISALTYLLVEQPCRRLGGRLAASYTTRRGD